MLGLATAISSSMRMTSTTSTPAIRYESTAAGPVWLITAPEPTNSPAPITPPSAIIVTCRRFSPVWSPCRSSLSGVLAMFRRVAGGSVHKSRRENAAEAAAPTSST